MRIGVVHSNAHRDRGLDRAWRGAGQDVRDRAEFGADGTGKRDALRRQVRAPFTGRALLGQGVATYFQPPHRRILRGGTLPSRPKTASVHVSNILAKLGVATRVEAAAIAHRARPGVMPASAAGSSMRDGHRGGVAVA